MLDTMAPSEGLLFASFLYRSDLHSSEDLKSRFEKLYGTCFVFIPSFNPLAEYYAKEMGAGNSLKRVFLIPVSTYPREYLVSGKLQALGFEKEWSLENKRTVNLDIGFLSPENFVLATTKNYSHRVYLSQNIFGDLTYYFHQGTLQTFPWTYPDYIDPEKIEFFTWLRQYLLQK